MQYFYADKVIVNTSKTTPVINMHICFPLQISSYSNAQPL